jgi:hypothetical protein
MNRAAAVACALLAPLAAGAQAPRWDWGAVLDLGYTTRPLALGTRDRGLELGHSDITVGGPLGPWLAARATASIATHGGELEKGIEELSLATTRLPAGFVLRAGRFSSQIGYLNAQHPHADDFVERPLLYRAFFGGHYYDDGARLTWTAPTPVFLQFGAEALRGKRLVRETAEPVGGVGVATFTVKTGADVGRAHAWQAGFSYVHNRRREAAIEDEEDHDHDHGHAHAHAHGAQFSGRRTFMVDAVWKWTPVGAARGQHVRAVLELARIERPNRFATARDRHEANTLALVWRFLPQWETGVRTDWLRVRIPHGDHFHWGLLREAAAMLVWKPSHMQSLRLQFTHQFDAVGFDGAARRSVQLQYVLGFGAHPAHAF